MRVEALEESDVLPSWTWALHSGRSVALREEGRTRSTLNKGVLVAVVEDDVSLPGQSKGQDRTAIKKESRV